MEDEEEEDDDYEYYYDDQDDDNEDDNFAEAVADAADVKIPALPASSSETTAAALKPTFTRSRSSLEESYGHLFREFGGSEEVKITESILLSTRAINMVLLG